MAKHTGLVNLVRKHYYEIVRLKNDGCNWEQVKFRLNLEYPTQKLLISFINVHKKINPHMKLFNRYRQGIKEFISKNYDEIEAMLAVGYSWSEVIEKLLLRSRFPKSKDLRLTVGLTVERTFYRLKRERSRTGK